jgi:hypothetical protein
MPPELWDVLDASPTTKTWKTPGREAQPDLAGARDRALLLVGFVAARSAHSRSTTSANTPTVSCCPSRRSKTNQLGTQDELVVLPRSTNPRRCPATVLQNWIDIAGIDAGPLFRPGQ